MKLFTLCLLVGFAAATSPNKLQWETQKEYRFQYSGRMLSGIPEMSTQNSGLGINCTVVLKAKTPSEIYLTIENPKYVSINGELESIDGSVTTDWRKLRLPEVQPVPEEHSRIMGRPIAFTIAETGDLKEIKVSKEEPSWSVNFKKAMVALLRVKFESGFSQLEDNMIGGSEHRDYWTVEEESLFGRCEASYQVNELPEWFVSERPELVPYPEACAEGKYFEITKAFDMDKCNKLSTFVNTRIGDMMCNTLENLNNCGYAGMRTSNTRYIACVSRHNPQQGLTVQSIVNDAGYQAQMVGHKSEYMVSGTYQVLRLKEVRPASSGSFPEIQQPITINDLMYEYGNEWYGRSQERELIPAAQLSGGRRSIYSLLGEPVAPKPEIESQIETLLLEATKEIHLESAEKSNVNKKLLSVVRAFMMIESKSDFVQLYGKINGGSVEETETAKQLFLDAAIMCGTPQAVSFLRTMIEENKLSKADVVHFFMWLPRNVIAPTKETLLELFHLATSEPVKRNPTVYSVAITAYAQLVQSACISTSRKAHFPIWVFGEPCNAESDIVQSQLIPYLTRQIHQAVQPDEEIRTIHVIALGLLQHKNAITELTPVVEGSTATTTDCKRGTCIDRLTATYFLAHGPGSANPSLVIPILSSVFSNPSESTDIRIASFNSLIKMNPPTHVFQAISAATRQETTMDPELLKIINVALYTLGHNAENCDSTLVSKARSAYATARKTYGFLPSSGIWYKTEFLKEMGLGYDSVIAWISSQRSVLPKSVGFHFGRFFTKYYQDTLDGSYWISDIEGIFEKVFGMENNANVKRQIMEGLSGQWKEVMEKLQLKARKGAEEGENAAAATQAMFYLNMLNGGHIVSIFGEKTVRTLKEKLSSFLKDTSSVLLSGGHTTINVQKTFDAETLWAIVPSDMGFPLKIEIRTPVTASLTGKTSLNFAAGKLAAPSFSFSGKVMLATHFSCLFGTSLPFTGEHLVTGIDHDSVINVPGTVNLKVNLPEQKASISVAPGSASTEVLHFEVTPYTTNRKFAELKPFSMSANAKPISATGAVMKQGSYRFGELLGLDLVAEAKTENGYTGLGAFYRLLSMYNGNPLNMLLFGNVSPAISESGKPSVRRYKYVVRFNPSGSTTKEIAMDVKFGLATKVEGEPAMYHSLKVKSESGSGYSSSTSGMSVGSILLNKIVPVEVQSEPISSSSYSGAQHSIHRQKLISSIDRIEAESATGFTLLYNVILKGGARPRTYSYSLTATLGGSKRQGSYGTVDQKWDVKVESESKKICVSGNMELPVLPMWNVEKLRTSMVNFKFNNKIAVGSNSCDDGSKVIVTGNAKTSRAQQSFSRESPEAKMCEKMMEMGVEGSKLSPVCDEVRMQAAALNEVVFKTEFVKVPRNFKTIENGAIYALKAYLWPYYSFGRSSSSSSDSAENHQTLTRIVFKQLKPTFDLTVDGPFGHVVFTDIHIRYPYSLFFPLKANSGSAALTMKKVFGPEAVAPTCLVGSKTVTTFANKTIGFAPGKCFHLLASDCSKHRTFGVTVRSSPEMGSSKKEVRVMLGKAVIELMPTQSSSEGPKVLIDGSIKEIPAGKHFEIKVGSKTATITRTTDGIVVIKAPGLMLNELKTDCEDIVVVPSQMLKNQLCGVCGNFNGLISGPNNCVYSRPEVAVASYRIPSRSCPALPENIKIELMKENERCAMPRIQRTKVAGSYKASTGKCTLLKHVIRHTREGVCISKIPITQCGPSCKSQEGSMVEKTVPFVCLQSTSRRLAQHYVSKSSGGETLEELKSMPVKYSASIWQPRHCVHSLVPY